MADGDSYRYWRRHGAEWGQEYARRLRRMPYYHLQELMLLEYVLAVRPARVLEFGCGVGRHLRNLAAVPDVDTFGYDQSPSMVAECRRWTSPAWLTEHVAVGAPLGPLPYADGTFDLVFTAEVLVHVAASDLATVLREIVRVCRGHVLHLEPGPDVALVEDVHAGCWHHDLPAAHAGLGVACEALPGGYPQQTPYRAVVRAPAPSFVWAAPVLSAYRRLEEQLGGTLRGDEDEVRRQEAELVGLTARLAATQGDNERLRERLREVEVTRAALLWNADLFLHRAGALLRR
jgi:SAM-dependent methyltransferase